MPVSNKRTQPYHQEITTTNPDPSVATTTNLLREITGSRELAQILVNFTREIVERQMKGDREIIHVRVDHLEKISDKQPTLISEATDQLRLNVEEKLKVFERQFANIQTQFEERDVRQETGRSDATKAIDAAFASADKAINKTETGFKDQIMEQGKRIDTVSKSADEKAAALKELINDQKDRVTILESRTQGIALQKSETVTVQHQQSSTIGIISSMIFGGLGFLLGLGSFVALLLKH